MYALTPPVWREPQQERSRKKVEAILNAALSIVAERGHEGLQMREVAHQAKVPVGTVYQFFDGREAILACLAARQSQWQDQEISARFENIQSIEGWLKAINGAIAVYYERSLQEPGISELWRAASVHKSVQLIDEASTIRHTALLSEMLRPLLAPSVNDDELRILCRMFCQLTIKVVQMALTMPPNESKLYIAQFERTIAASLDDLASKSD